MSPLLGAGGQGLLRDDGAMSGNQEDRERAVRRPRVVRRPAAGPGPLGELKELLYRLYLEAGPPTLERIAALIAAGDGLDGSPEKDTIARCLPVPLARITPTHETGCRAPSYSPIRRRASPLHASSARGSPGPPGRAWLRGCCRRA